MLKKPALTAVEWLSELQAIRIQAAGLFPRENRVCSALFVFPIPFFQQYNGFVRNHVHFSFNNLFVFKLLCFTQHNGFVRNNFHLFSINCVTYLASFGFVCFPAPLFSTTYWLRSSKIDTLFFRDSRHCPGVTAPPWHGHPRPVPGTRSGPSDGNGPSRGGPAG